MISLIKQTKNQRNNNKNDVLPGVFVCQTFNGCIKTQRGTICVFKVCPIEFKEGVSNIHESIDA